ncbi:hypothetical protein MTO96_029499, partial [Rhipicephalus appendiculatus]
MRHFLTVYLRALRHDRRMLFSHPPSRLQMLLWQVGHTGKMRYVPDDRTVVVPGVYQMEPYTYLSSSADEYMPEYINYGTMGALLSWELAKIVNRRRDAARKRSGDTGHQGRTGMGGQLPEQALLPSRPAPQSR